MVSSEKSVDVFLYNTFKMSIFAYYLITLCITLKFVTSNKLKNNVVIILIDDMRLITDTEVNLTNLKKIAGKGTSFRNAFAQQALCAPSRNSILTGRYPDSLRLYDFYSYWRDTVANFTTLPQFFKEHAYETYSFGKVFHPGASCNCTDDYPYSWSHKPYHAPSEKFKDAAVCRDPTSNQLKKNLICPVRVKHQQGKTLPDLEILNSAINLLKSRNKKVPLFLAVGFHKPHIPLKFPKKYLAKLPISEVQPPTFPHFPGSVPTVAWHPWTDIRKRDDIKRLNITFPFGTMPLEWTLKIKQSYFAASLYVDNLIGRLMEYVDTRNTIVVITSDHGWSLGENGMWAKYSNFDVALKVPLIFLAPGPGARPTVVDTPVELIDIFPTIVELAEIEHNIPDCKGSNDKTHLCFEGKSLAPLIHETKPKVTKTFTISQYPRPSEYPRHNSDKPRLKDIKIMGYTVRTERYRYTEWVGFNSTLFTKDWNTIYGTELYDHTVDPAESNNVVLSAKYLHVRNKLSQLLRTQVNK